MKKCFANSLDDCSGGLSREHFISKSILEFVTDGDGLLDLGGPLDRGKRLSPQNTAVSKILCKKHNSELSDYDAVALNLIKEVFDFNSSPNDKIIKVGSDDFTLWIVKLILGYYASQGKTEYIGDRETISYLVKMLYKRISVPENFGFSIYKGEQINNPPQKTFREGGYPPWVFQMFEKENRVGGLNLWIYPLHFVFHFSGEDHDQNQFFKPKEFNFCDKSTQKNLSICFV